MRVVTWNCNQNLKDKFHLLDKFDADIIFIQEAELLPPKFFSDYVYQWTGLNDKKGVGTLFKNQEYVIPSNFNKDLIYYLPTTLSDLNVINVWSYGHRASKFGPEVNGYPLNAFSHYLDFIKANKKTIILGDFNHSVIWDEKMNANKFMDIQHYLKELDFVSAYHSFNEEDFGNESSATLYHTKNIDKKYHIDYAFIKGFTLNSIEIGTYLEWIDYSDHMPLILDFSLFNKLIYENHLYFLFIAFANCLC